MDTNNAAAQLRPTAQITAWIATFVLSFCTSAAIAADTLDRVVAVVNKDVILDSEVKQRARDLQNSQSEQSTANLLLQKALDNLISEKLQLQAAKRAGINADEASIDRAVNSVAARNKLNLQQFKQALQQQGINYTDYRKTIAITLTLNSLKQRRSAQEAEVTDQEVNDLITAESRQITASRSYHIQDILIPTPNPTSLTTANKAKNTAHQLRKLALESKDFMSVKLGNSSAKDWGWRESGKLSFVYLAELTKLEPGQISDVISDAQGYHVLKLINHRGGSDLKAQQVRVRHILVAAAQPDAQSKINTLRQQILAGADFGKLAMANSDDTGSAQNAGDLGWSDSKRYVPEFAQATETLALKTLSPVIKTKFGFHILEVLDRREVDASRRSLENQARKLLSEKKQEQDYDAWIQGLRSSAFIEFKKP